MQQTKMSNVQLAILTNPTKNRCSRRGCPISLDDSCCQPCCNDNYYESCQTIGQTGIYPGQETISFLFDSSDQAPLGCPCPDQCPLPQCYNPWGGLDRYYAQYDFPYGRRGEEGWNE